MQKSYAFSDHEIENIIARFGKAFYEKVLRDIEVYADKWSLTSFQLIPSYSANLVFTCRSERYGPAVLKVANPSFGEFNGEFYMLTEHNGRPFCKVFEADLDHGIILEERIMPGTPLRDESSLDERLSVFSSLYNGLHKPSAHAEKYSTYTGWVGRITESMSTREDCMELYSFMKKANEICQSIARAYPRQMLLHGDFHHDNILLGLDGEYVIIDPKGVIGDPVFDVPRFILNEFGDEITPDLFKKINEIISTLEIKLRIPIDILRQCLFVEWAMGACWNAEDGATPEEYSRLVEKVAFAETIMNGR